MIIKKWLIRKDKEFRRILNEIMRLDRVGKITKTAFSD